MIRLHARIRSSLDSRVSSRALRNFFTFQEKKQSKDQHNNRMPLYSLAGGTLTLVYSLSYVQSKADASNESAIAGVSFEKAQVLSNWSSTHTCSPRLVFEPKSAQEVCRILRTAHDTGEKLRPIGTGLSPNGIGMSNKNLISLSNIDYVEVDTKRNLVTVGAGARVIDVLKALNAHGLTLENFSSIQEQQMGGWTQVAAHGTGCSLPTVEEMVVRMKLATPTEGLLTLSPSSNPDLFSMAKVGLGSLGVVTELTMKCIPKLDLREHTFTTTVEMVKAEHDKLLSEFRHVRYMWLPYTEDVVVVVSNPSDVTVGMEKTIVNRIKTHKEERDNKGKIEIPTKPLYELLLKILPTYPKNKAEKLSFSQLRDILLDFAPLNVNHIKNVNIAESEFWKASTGSRTDDSTNILGFDCGGEQWVLEVCFPIGTLSEKTGKDIDFVKKLLKIIKDKKIAAPCPIEQRWTARSTAKMSPAYSEKEGDIFSWVGIIMYLPPGQNEVQREEITKKFFEYVNHLEPLLDEYKAQCHWAKIELPLSMEPDSEPLTPMESTPKFKKNEKSWWGALFKPEENEKHEVKLETREVKLEKIRKRVMERYPVRQFNRYRMALDPKNVLGNDLINEIFKEK